MKTGQTGERASGDELDQRPALSLLLDSQDLKAVLGEIGRSRLTRAGVRRQDVTALLIDAQTEGGEVWAAETRFPGSLKAIYTRIR